MHQGWDDVIWNANECELSYLHIHFVKGNTSDLVPRPTRLLCYTELGTETNLETLTLFVRPDHRRLCGRWSGLTKRVRVSGLKFDIFFWVWVRVRVYNGLWRRISMFTFVHNCTKSEPTRGPVRIRSHDDKHMNKNWIIRIYVTKVQTNITFKIKAHTQGIPNNYKLL